MTNEDLLTKARDDFRVFVWIVWKHLGLPDPTPVQYDISRYLQTGPRRIVIEAFRGVGKSWLTSAFVCWLLFRNPQLKILVVSASKERADQFSSFVKRLIGDVPMLQHLHPKEGQRNSMIAFDVGPATPDHSPSVKSVGITGQITGSRADVIIADDVEVPNNSATQLMRDKLSEAVKEFDAILKPLSSSRIIYLGTPQTEMSLYNQLPERGYEVRVWPALYPTEAEAIRYKGTLAPMIANGSTPGSPTDPRRFDEDDLAERRLSYGRQGFALQFMLDTTLSDADRYPLKLGDLMVMHLNPTMAPVKVAWGNSPELVLNDVPNVGLTGDRYVRPVWHSPDMSEYTGCVMFIDPSGRGSDETGYAVVKHLTGTLYVPDVGGLRSGYSVETLEALARRAQQHAVKLILVESNFGDGMFIELLKPVLQRIYPCMVEEVRATTQKEARIIETLEPVMSSHRLVVDHKLIQRDFDTAGDLKYSLMYQMTRLTRDKGSLRHDDRLDALAGAVEYWTKSMAVDADKAARAIHDRAIDSELRKFMRSAMGGRGGTRGSGWMSRSRHR